MIRFSLICDSEHEFEAWFRSNDDFDKQVERKLVTCASCGSTSIGLTTRLISGALLGLTVGLADDIS